MYSPKTKWDAKGGAYVVASTFADYSLLEISTVIREGEQFINLEAQPQALFPELYQNVENITPDVDIQYISTLENIETADVLAQIQTYSTLKTNLPSETEFFETRNDLARYQDNISSIKGQNTIILDRNTVSSSKEYIEHSTQISLKTASDFLDIVASTYGHYQSTYISTIDAYSTAYTYFVAISTIEEISTAQLQSSIAETMSTIEITPDHSTYVGLIKEFADNAELSTITNNIKNARDEQRTEILSTLSTTNETYQNYSTILFSVQTEYDRVDGLVQDAISSYSGYQSRIDDETTFYNHEYINYVSILTEYQKVEATHSLHVKRDELDRATQKENDALSVYNSTISLLQETELYLKASQNGQQIFPFTARSTLSGSFIIPDNTSLHLVYQSVSTAVPIAYSNFQAKEAERRAIEQTMNEFNTNTLNTMLTGFDTLITEVTEKYIEAVENKATAISTFNSVSTSLIAKQSLAIPSSVITGHLISSITDYDKTCADYQNKIDISTYQLYETQYKLDSIDATIYTEESKISTSMEMIEGAQSQIETLTNSLNNLYNNSTIITSTLQSGFSQSGGGMLNLAKVQLAPMLSARNTDLDILNTAVINQNRYTSSILGYECNKYLQEVMEISTIISIDIADKRAERAEKNMQMITDYTMLDTLSTFTSELRILQPSLTELIDTLQAERICKNIYSKYKNEYEIQTINRLTTIVETNTITTGEYEQLKTDYDLFTDDCNRYTEKRQSIYSIVEPTLKNFILNDVIGKERITLLTQIIKVTQSEQTISIPPTVSNTGSYLQQFTKRPLRKDTQIGKLITNLIPSREKLECSAPQTSIDVPIQTVAQAPIPTTTDDLQVYGYRGRYIEITKDNGNIEILQLLVINEDGKNIAYQKPVQLDPPLFEIQHSIDKQFITNGTYNVIQFFNRVHSMGSRQYNMYYFNSPEGEQYDTPKKVRIDLGATYDIVAVHYVRFPNEYDSTGLKISILDSNEFLLGTKTVESNYNYQVLDFRTGSQPTISTSLKPLRKGVCGLMSRYVRVYPPPKVLEFKMSQIAILNSSSENIAPGKSLQFFKNGQPLVVSNSNLLIDGELRARTVSECVVIPLLSTDILYMEIDLGEEMDVPAVHIFNCSDIPTYPMIGTKVQLITEERLLATERALVTSLRREILDFRYRGSDSSCSSRIRWPAYYGKAGVIAKSMRVTKIGGTFGLSKVQVVDKNGKDVALYRPVVVSSNLAKGRIPVGSNSRPLPAEQCWMSQNMDGGGMIQIYFDGFKEVCAVRVFGIDGQPQNFIGATVSLFDENDREIISKPLKSTTDVLLDFRREPEESGYGTTVTSTNTKYGMLGTIAQYVVFPANIGYSIPTVKVLDYAGRNIRDIVTTTIVDGQDGVKIMNLSQQFEINAVCFESSTISNINYVQLRDCNNILVGENQFTTVNSFQTATFLNPSNGYKYAPTTPLPIEDGGHNTGTMAQFIKVIPRPGSNVFRLSQLIAVDSSGINVAFEKEAFSVPAQQDLTLVRRIVDGGYMNQYENANEKPDFVLGFYSEKYYLKPQSLCFELAPPPGISVFDKDANNPSCTGGSANDCYVLIDLGGKYEITSVVVVAGDGLAQYAEGAIIELYNSAGARVGVNVVSPIIKVFDVDILDFRRSWALPYDDINAWAPLEVRERVLSAGDIGMYLQYIRLERVNKTNNTAIELSQIVVMGTDGTIISMYKPTYATTNLQDSWRAVDGRMYLRTKESDSTKPAYTADYGFSIPATATGNQYIEINLGAEYEIQKIYVFPTKEGDATFTNLRLRLYNKERDVIGILDNIGTAPNVNIETIFKNQNANSNDLKLIGVNTRKNLLTEKVENGLIPGTVANTPGTTTSSLTRIPGRSAPAERPNLAPRFQFSSRGGIQTRYIRMYNVDNYIQISQFLAYDENRVEVTSDAGTTIYATSTYPGSDVRRAIDKFGGIYHTARLQADSYISNKKRYDYVEISFASEKSLVAFRYIMPNSNRSRNIGTRIQFLNSDRIILTEYTLLRKDVEKGNDLLIDIRPPTPGMKTIDEIIAPPISSLAYSAGAPIAIAFSATGDLYISNMNKHNVKKLSPTSVFSSSTPENFAGQTSEAAGADTSSLQYPGGIVCTSSQLYICDYGNNRLVRRLLTGLGSATTISDSRFQNPFAICTGNNKIYFSEYVSGGKVFSVNFDDTGFARLGTATFNFITQMVFANNTIYAVEFEERSIKTIHPTTGVATELLNFASRPELGVNKPFGIAIDEQNQILYFSDFLGDRVYSARLNATDIYTTITRIAGTGQGGFYEGDDNSALTARFDSPGFLYYVYSITDDTSVQTYRNLQGKLYIVDKENSRIRYIDLKSGPVTPVTPPDAPETWCSITTTTRPGDDIAIIPRSGPIPESMGEIETITPAKLTTIVSQTSETYRAFCYDKINEVSYIIRIDNQVIMTTGTNLFTGTTVIAGTSANTYNVLDAMNYNLGTANSITTDATGDWIYISCSNPGNKIIKIPRNPVAGKRPVTIVTQASGLGSITCLQFDNNGILYFVDGARYIKRINLFGEIETVAGIASTTISTTETFNPRDDIDRDRSKTYFESITSIAFDSQNTMYIVDNGATYNCVYQMTTDLRIYPFIINTGGTLPAMHTFTDYDAITKRSNEVYIQGVHSIAIYQDSRNGDRIYCSSNGKHQLYTIKILPQSVLEANQIVGRRQLVEITIYGGLGKGDSPGYNVDQDYALYANYNSPTQIVAIKNSDLEPSLYVIDNERRAIRCIHAPITREVSYTGLIRAGPVSYFGNSNMRLADGIGYDISGIKNMNMNIDISGGSATGETSVLSAYLDDGRLAIDTNGILFYSSYNKYCIQRIDPSTKIIQTIRGIYGRTSTSDTEGFDGQNGICVLDSYIYVCDRMNKCVKRINRNPPYEMTRVVGTGSAPPSGSSITASGDTGVSALSVALDSPSLIVSHPLGYIYILNVNRDLGVYCPYRGSGSNFFWLGKVDTENFCTTFCVDADCRNLYFLQTGKSKVSKLALNNFTKKASVNPFIYEFCELGNGSTISYIHIPLNEKNNLYFCDYTQKSVRVLDLTTVNSTGSATIKTVVGPNNNRDTLIGQSLYLPSFTPAPNTILAQTYAVENYELTFDITVNSTPTNFWRNIFQFSKTTNADSEFGDRTPAIWFVENTTQLHIRIGDSTNWNWGIQNTVAIPLNIKHRVTIRCIGSNVTITIVNTVTNVNLYLTTLLQPGNRYTGPVYVFGSGPYANHATNCRIENFSYIQLGIPSTRLNASITLSGPKNFVFDSAMNMYLCDYIEKTKQMSILYIKQKTTMENGNIYTVAGTGINSTTDLRDGSLATTANFANPRGCAYDMDENIYIADTDNHRIRRIDKKTGIITTFVGTGVAGDSGEGGLATSAQLRSPQDIVFDRNNNMYILDSSNYKVKKVSYSGSGYIITTIAGTGTQGNTGDDGPAIRATLDEARNIMIDKNENIYIAFGVNNNPTGHIVRKIDKFGFITRVAGTSNGTFRSTPDFTQNGQLATNVPLREPFDMAMNSVGELFIIERTGHRLLKVDTAGRIYSVAGTGVAGYSGDDGGTIQFNTPTGMDIHPLTDEIYISDQANHRVRKLTVAGNSVTAMTVIGNGTPGFSSSLTNTGGLGGDGGPADQATVFQPNRMSISRDGYLLLTEWENPRVRVVPFLGPGASTSTQIVTLTLPKGVQHVRRVRISKFGTDTENILQLQQVVVIDANGENIALDPLAVVTGTPRHEWHPERVDSYYSQLENVVDGAYSLKSMYVHSGYQTYNTANETKWWQIEFPVDKEIVAVVVYFRFTCNTRTSGAVVRLLSSSNAVLDQRVVTGTEPGSPSWPYKFFDFRRESGGAQAVPRLMDSFRGTCPEVFYILGPFTSKTAANNFVSAYGYRLATYMELEIAISLGYTVPSGVNGYVFNKDVAYTTTIASPELPSVAGAGHSAFVYGIKPASGNIGDKIVNVNPSWVTTPYTPPVQRATYQYTWARYIRVLATPVTSIIVISPENGMNIAYGKKIYKDGGTGDQRVLDTLINGNGYFNTSTSNVITGAKWIEIDLGAEYKIDSVLVYTNANSSDVTVRCYTENRLSKDFTNKQVSGFCVICREAKETADPKEGLLGGTRGVRKVVVESTGEPIQIEEIGIFDVNGINVGIDKQISASSYHFSDDNLWGMNAQAIFNTSWINKNYYKCFRTNRGANEFYEVIFTTPIGISKIEYYNSAINMQFALNTEFIFFRQDNTEVTRFQITSEIKSIYEFTISNTSLISRFRYGRISGSDPLQISKLNIFNRDNQLVRNVAPEGTPSSQISNFEMTVRASSSFIKRSDFTIDGSYDINGVDEIPSNVLPYHSNTGIQTYTINLLSDYEISFVQFWNRTNCCNSRSASYKLKLLDSTGTTLREIPFKGHLKNEMIDCRMAKTKIPPHIPYPTSKDYQLTTAIGCRYVRIEPSRSLYYEDTNANVGLYIYKFTVYDVLWRNVSAGKPARSRGGRTGGTAYNEENETSILNPYTTPPTTIGTDYVFYTQRDSAWSSDVFWEVDLGGTYSVNAFEYKHLYHATASDGVNISKTDITFSFFSERRERLAEITENV